MLDEAKREGQYVLDQGKHAYEAGVHKVDEIAHSDEVRRATEKVQQVIDDSVAKTSQLYSQGRAETEHLIHDVCACAHLSGPSTGDLSDVDLRAHA